MEFPKMLYRGTWTRESGPHALERVIVADKDAEAEKLDDGFVVAEDIESLIVGEAKPKAKAKGKPSKDDE